MDILRTAKEVTPKIVAGAVLLAGEAACGYVAYEAHTAAVSATADAETYAQFGDGRAQLQAENANEFEHIRNVAAIAAIGGIAAAGVKGGLYILRLQRRNNRREGDASYANTDFQTAHA